MAGTLLQPAVWYSWTTATAPVLLHSWGPKQGDPHCGATTAGIHDMASSPGFRGAVGSSYMWHHLSLSASVTWEQIQTTVDSKAGCSSAPVAPSSRPPLEAPGKQLGTFEGAVASPGENGAFQQRHRGLLLSQDPHTGQPGLSI